MGGMVSVNALCWATAAGCCVGVVLGHFASVVAFKKCATRHFLRVVEGGTQATAAQIHYLPWASWIVRAEKDTAKEQKHLSRWEKAAATAANSRARVVAMMPAAGAIPNAPQAVGPIPNASPEHVVDIPEIVPAGPAADLPAPAPVAPLPLPGNPQRWGLYW